MAYFKIGNTDFSNCVSALKVGTETLVSEDSGRNANGDTVLDIINKKYKIYTTFRPMDEEEMSKLMSALSAYVINVSFLNPLTNTITTATCYTGTPEPEYYTIQKGKILFKSMNLNFIEM